MPWASIFPRIYLDLLQVDLVLMIASDSKALYNSEHGCEAIVRGNEVAKRPSERGRLVSPEWI